MEVETAALANYMYSVLLSSHIHIHSFSFTAFLAIQSYSHGEQLLHDPVNFKMVPVRYRLWMPHPVGGAMGVICHDDIWRGYARFDIISLNIHKTLHWFCTFVALWPQILTFACLAGTKLQLFLRYSVEIYMCTNALELISWHKTQQESIWVA